MSVKNLIESLNRFVIMQKLRLIPECHIGCWCNRILSIDSQNSLNTQVNGSKLGWAYAHKSRRLNMNTQC